MTQTTPTRDETVTFDTLAKRLTPAPASGRVDAVKAALDAVNSIAAFEHWAQSAGHYLHLSEQPDRRFVYEITEQAWLAWCAARASLSPAATPVSEAGGDETTKIALGHFKTTTERAQRITELEQHLRWALDNLHMIGDQSDEAEQARAALAKPASSDSKT